MPRFSEEQLFSYSLWTALVTPLTDSLEINFKDLEALVLQQEKAGNGILILGSTGESLNLSLDQKTEVLEFIKKLNLSVPIMCGIGGIQLEETKSWLRNLENYPIDAYLAVTPLYAKPGDKGQYYWFKELLDLSTRPMMLYNVPGRTGVALSYEAVGKLKNHPNFWSIKDASGRVEDFQKYSQSANKALYCGDDALMSDFAKKGSCGLVSVASNVWPEAFSYYVKSCLKGDLENSTVWQEASNKLFLKSNPIPAKVLMHEKGMISSSALMPPLTHLEISEIELQTLREADQAIKNIFELKSTHSRLL